MADNRLFLRDRVSGDQVMIAKKFGGHWTTPGDVDGRSFQERLDDLLEDCGESDDFDLLIEHGRSPGVLSDEVDAACHAIGQRLGTYECNHIADEMRDLARAIIKQVMESDNG